MKSINNQRNRVVWKWWLVLLIAFVIGGNMHIHSARAKDKPEFRYGTPSFTPDSSKLVFNRYPAASGDAQIHVLDLKSGKLSYYQPLPNQDWFAAKFSPAGDKVVFVAVPYTQGDSPGGGFRHFEDAQIAIMDANGRNVRMLTRHKGYKMAPNFSWSGKKVIYTQGQLRPPGSKTPATRMDAYEIDLESGSIRQLTDFEFYQMGRPSYLPGDSSFVVNADGPSPSKIPGLTQAERDNYDFFSSPLSQDRLYRFDVSGPPQPLSPLLKELYLPSFGTADSAGNIYFRAYPNKNEKGRIYRYSAAGRLDSWEDKPRLQTRSAEISPDGRFWVDISAPISDPEDLNGIFMLDLTEGVWREIPANGRAELINP